MAYGGKLGDTCSDKQHPRTDYIFHKQKLIIDSSLQFKIQDGLMANGYLAAM